MTHGHALATGALFALAAGLMWGLVFVAPLLLPEYDAAILSFGRYLAFGIIALVLGAWDRRRLVQLTRADWVEAGKLALVGNIAYYLFLAGAIQRAGGPLPTMIIGTLPVVIAVTSNLRGAGPDIRLPWRRLAPSLLLIGGGIALVNHSELSALRQEGAGDAGRYGIGALLAVGAVACWTWYPIRNADWLRAHPDRSPGAWATAQGLATLPLAAVGFAGVWLWHGLTASQFPMPLGPDPWRFVTLMAIIGLCASWLGTLCWNAASQRLPTTLSGQLIVFETLAALAYAYALRDRVPGALALAGVAALVGGVIWALRARPETAAAAAAP